MTASTSYIAKVLTIRSLLLWIALTDFGLAGNARVPAMLW
jgi:hypothetical protein